MYLQRRIEEMTASHAAAYGCSGAVDWRLGDQPYYPPTVNDPAAAAFARGVASGLLGEARVVETEPIMVGGGAVVAGKGIRWWWKGGMM